MLAHPKSRQAKEEIEMRVAFRSGPQESDQQLQKRIANIAQEIERLQEEILTVERTNPARSKGLREIRLETYENLFKSWKKEQVVLESLYEPVRGKLQRGLSEEKMLDFYIRWDVDLEHWLERGNELFDQRRGHPFGSSLKFREAVQSSVAPGWERATRNKSRPGWRSSSIF